jgi:hypothetical protein
MAMAISTYHLNTTDNPIANGCTETCNSASTIISNIRWSENDSIIEDEDEEEEDDEEDEEDEEDDEDDVDPVLMWGDAAPSLMSGYCDTTNCTECRESWYDDTPNDKAYRCKDETIFKYRNKCGKKRLRMEGKNKCMTGDETGEDQYCHWSFPADDKKKGKSEFAACRTVPQDYIEGDWKYGKKPKKNFKKGLCRYDDCEELGGTCNWSWPMGEKGKHAKGMFRCLLTEL